MLDYRKCLNGYYIDILTFSDNLGTMERIL